MIYITIFAVCASIVWLFWSGNEIAFLKQALLFPVFTFWKILLWEMPHFLYLVACDKGDNEKESLFPTAIFSVAIGLSIIGILAAVFGKFSSLIVLGPIVWLAARWWFLGRGDGSGNLFVGGARMAPAAELATLHRNKEIQLEIGGIPLPYQAEPAHLFCVGMPGTGKSHTINGLLDPIRERNNKLMMVDSGGESLSKWYRKGDFILNPFDRRTVSWSPLAEMADVSDATRIAAAFIEEGQGSAKEWNGYARNLFTAVLERVFEQGGTNKDIVRLAALSSDEELKELVGDQPVAAIFAKGAERMLGSVKAIIGMKLNGFKWLDPDAGNAAFSLSRWATDDENRHWVWISYKDVFFEQMKPLISTWIGLLTAAVLSLDELEDDSRRIFLFADEIGALPAISGFEAALSRGRKYGLCVVAGTQTISQLREKYGRDLAQTLMGCFGSWLILRPGDEETGKAMELHLGMVQLIRTETSTTESDNGTSTNTSYRNAKECLVMCSDIMKFPDLHGVLTLAKGIPATVVDIPMVKRKRIVETWVRREFPKSKAMPKIPTPAPEVLAAVMEDF